jgi:FHS family glucose/mannose:H+ symporter-like MFS transporter
MHAVFVLAGLGTMLLGPILPLLAAHWRLDDAQSGLLPLAQFCGATLGGVTVSSRLARDLQRGLILAGLGFTIFAIAPSFLLALPALLCGGFGVGRIIASVNIIAGARYTASRGSSLARLNFTWSFGALLSPLLAAWLSAIPLNLRLIGFAILFLVCAAVLDRQPVDPGEAASSSQAPEPPLAVPLFVYFAALLFLYGGLETSLSVWLTTYAIRFGQTSFVLSEYTLVLLLCGLTAGRALASWLLLTMRDTTLQRIALVLAAGLAAALAAAHQASLIATLAVLLGVALAPVFPATFALLMAHRPPARTAGIALAASGLGAAALPSLIGAISTHTGSLRIALTVPVAAALAMLLMSFANPKKA